MTLQALFGETLGASSWASSRSPQLTFAFTPTLGDYVFMFTTSNTVAAITTPADWTNPLGGNTTVDSDSHTVCAVLRPVTAAEISTVTTTYTCALLFNAGVAGRVNGCILRDPDRVVAIEGIDAVGTGFSSTDTATPHVIAGLTGSQLSTGSLVLGCVASDGSLTYTDPAGWTVVVKNPASNTGCWIGTNNTLTTAGVDVTATNITPSSGDEYASITLAFLPVRPSSGFFLV